MSGSNLYIGFLELVWVFGLELVLVVCSVGWSRLGVRCEALSLCSVQVGGRYRTWISGLGRREVLVENLDIRVLWESTTGWRGV